MKRHCKRLIRTWINFFVYFITAGFSMILISASVVALSACSNLLSSSMPPGSISMKQAYNQALDGDDDTDADEDGGNAQADNSLSPLRTQVKPLQQADPQEQPEDMQDHGIADLEHQFQQLPNPEIVMTVYPHLVGEGANQVPVPGYSTVFSLYQRTYYLPRS